jgi:ATP-dependent Clp protease ATP-binding subunit ClpA
MLCGLFERFTERARHVVVLAQAEAREFKHDFVGAEHLLLGLLREEEGMAARVLGSFGVTVEHVRQEVLRLVEPGIEVTPGPLPFDPRAKSTFVRSLRESQALGHNYLGTEHLLLGLAGENEGVAHQILLGCGADAKKIRDAVVGLLAGPSSTRSFGLPSGVTSPTRHQLEGFTHGAREAVDLAREEAQELGHRHVGVEHLLLGLLREQDGVAAQVLGSLDITAEYVRAHVLKIVASGEDRSAQETPFSAPLTPRASRVLTHARREALLLKSEVVGTEHILLGLVREDGGITSRILLELGAGSLEVRDAVIGRLPARELEVAAPSSGRVALGEVWIRIGPSADLRDLLRAAGSHALESGREQIKIPDLLLALTRDASTRQRLAALGVDEALVGNAIEQRRASDPPAASA